MTLRHEPITSLAPRLVSGQLSAEALLDECLAAITAQDAELRAILTLDPRARTEAEACDREARAGRPRGPLHGIPIVVKDNIDVAGLPTTSGCRALVYAMPRQDAAQIVRMKAAGAIIIAKANLSEFSFEIRSRSSLGGDVRNPFAPHATSGGSSGGAAVAVACGFAAAGLGSDTGGSIRVPASYNGLVGLRPTHGLLDIAGVAPLAPSTDTVAPLARSIADTALLFKVMGGRPGRRDARGLRVGVMRQAFGTNGEIADTCERAGAVLAYAGAEIVDPVTLPDEILPIGRPHIVDAEFADAFDAYLAGNFLKGTAPPDLETLVVEGRYLAEYRDDLQRRMRDRGKDRDAILAYHADLQAALDGLMRRHRLDALLHPTSMVLPETLDNPKGGWAPELAACSGWPALSVPAGASARGMPIGVELLGRAGSEGLLLSLGAAIERSLGPRRLPPAAA